MSWQRARWVVLLVLVAIGVGVALRSRRRLVAMEQTMLVCDTLNAGAVEEALRRGEPLLQSLDPEDPMFVDAAHCVTQAYAILDRRSDAVALADRLRPELGTGWLSDPVLAMYIAGGYLQKERTADALALLQDVGTRATTSVDLLRMQLSLVVAQADRAGVAAIQARAQALPPEMTTALRTSLGRALASLGELDAGLAAMEPSPKAGDPDGRAWWTSRAWLLGEAGRQADLAATFQRWEAEGGTPREIYLYYVVISELTHQFYGERPIEVELRDAIDHAPPETDAELLAVAWRRLITAYVNTGQVAQALAVYDEAAARGVVLNNVRRDEISRAQLAAAGSGTLSFAIPAAQAGDVRRVSPPADAPVDTPYETLPLDGARPVSVRRPASPLPARWVWADRQGRAIRSGAVVVQAAEEAAVTVDARPDSPPAAPPPFELKRLPADGRRRVYTLVLDCVDWRLVRLMDARGELPALAALERAGLAGVLTSEPAFTGVAMEKLAHPRTREGITFLGFLHHLGVEAAGLEAVGTNPLEGLGWVLPDSPYLVDVVGAADRVAANLLFAVGDMDSSRDMEVVGPRGAREELVVRRQRPLSEAEIAALPGLGRPPDRTTRGYLEGIAAQMDLAVSLAASKRLDLLLLRLAQTDLMTHTEFANINRTAVDDADNVLLWAYRYVDRRLGELANATDEDDVLIVMSDHGIQTSMLHDPHAVFVMIGGQRGRLTGAPELAGLPRLMVDLLGVPPVAGWPDTGLSAAAIPGFDAQRPPG